MQVHGFVFIENLAEVGIGKVLQVARAEQVQKGFMINLLQVGVAWGVAGGCCSLPCDRDTSYLICIVNDLLCLRLSVCLFDTNLFLYLTD